MSKTQRAPDNGQFSQPWFLMPSTKHDPGRTLDVRLWRFAPRLETTGLWVERGWRAYPPERLLTAVERSIADRPLTAHSSRSQPLASIKIFGTCSTPYDINRLSVAEFWCKCLLTARSTPVRGQSKIHARLRFRLLANFDPIWTLRGSAFDHNSGHLAMTATAGMRPYVPCPTLR
jgi:hypothetical protein